MKREDIRKKVRKKDGKRPCLRAVDGVLKKFEEDPQWDGCEERTEGGRPRDLTQQQEKKDSRHLAEGCWEEGCERNFCEKEPATITSSA